MKRIFVATTLSFVAAVQAGAQDIFLARISSAAAGKPVVEAPQNITRRAGYDNQPSFTRDARAVLYTSTREDQQADIYTYDLESRMITRLTMSAPESEYSATILPTGTGFSVIRVERDSAQRLWSFSLSGGDPQVLVPGVKPVGYHAWAGNANIAMFVLGSPNTLQLFDIRSSRVDTITTAIGRSLVAIPQSNSPGQPVPSGEGLFSFVKREGSNQSPFTLYSVDTRARPIAPKLITVLPAGSEYVAWLSATRVITGQGSKLLMYDTAAGGSWTEIADLSSGGVSGISRLAIGSGPSGIWIAMVAAD